jgi:uncharacterized coiled-coil protein SlyX
VSESVDRAWRPSFSAFALEMAAPAIETVAAVAEPHLRAVGAAVDAFARGEWPEDVAAGERARDAVAALRAIVAAEDAVVDDSLQRLRAMQGAVAASQASMAAMSAAMADSALLARVAALEGTIATQQAASDRLASENAWLRRELTLLRGRVQKLENPGAARGVRHLLVRDGEADGGRRRAVDWDDAGGAEGEEEVAAEGDADAADLAAKVARKPPTPACTGGAGASGGAGAGGGGVGGGGGDS